MSATITSLRSLAERLEKAKAPDRELDALLHFEFALKSEHPGWLDLACEVAKRRLERGWTEDAAWHNAQPSYTSSLDAAVAQCERLGAVEIEISDLAVHGIHTSVALDHHLKSWGEVESDPSEKTYLSREFCPTASMRLCLALVRALIAKEQKQ